MNKNSKKTLEILRIEIGDIINSYKNKQLSRETLEKLSAELNIRILDIIPECKIKTSVSTDRTTEEIKIKITPLNEETLNLFKNI